MTETLTCPHCAKTLTTDKTISLPDDRGVKCAGCQQRFTLGEARPKQSVLDWIEAPPAPKPNTVKCPMCREEIAYAAMKCKHCGEYLDGRVTAPVQPVVQVIHAQPTWSSGVAAALSFIIPGLGQIYKGQPINGIVWFFLVVFGYCFFIVPGLLLHLVCIVGAANRGKSEVQKIMS